MGCLAGLAASITNDCAKQPTAGLERKVWLINRADIATITHDGVNNHLITAITLNTGKTAFVFTAYRKDVDAGFDEVVRENLPPAFTHYFKMEPWDQNSDQVEELDNMEDLVAIVEKKGDKTYDSGDGYFQIYGLQNGLYKTSGTQRLQDNGGVPTYEFGTREGEEEPYSKHIFYDTDYATSLAALVALES